MSENVAALGVIKWVCSPIHVHTHTNPWGNLNLKYSMINLILWPRTPSKYEDKLLLRGASNFFNLLAPRTSNFSRRVSNTAYMLLNSFVLYFSANGELNVRASPSMPVFYRYSFPSDADYVLVRVKSYDNTCAIFSVQNILVSVAAIGKFTCILRYADDFLHGHYIKRLESDVHRQNMAWSI